MISEAQHAISLGLQKDGSILIISFLQSMSVTIDFDDKHVRNAAGEIDNVTPDDDLPAKLRAFEPLRAQSIPELQLERCLLGPQPFCVIQ